MKWILPVLIATMMLLALPASAEVREVTLEVEGMVCPACPPNVHRALSAVEGVSDVQVSLETHTAVVRFDPRKTQVEDLLQATRRAGYPSSLRE